jgi:hypothetical protein
MNNAPLIQQKNSKFIKWMFWGACAGAALSLLDKNTRDTVAASSKTYMNGAVSMVKNPNSALNQVRSVSANIRKTVENISDDVAFIQARVEELKEIPPQVAHVVMETKEAFAPNQKTEAKTSSIHSVH